MKNYAILPILLILSIAMISIDNVYGQVDLLSDILFLQTGEISTAESQFQISSDVEIREFFGGNIVRISGLTIEGFPYITYSRIIDEKTDTKGIIFINGKFVSLSFIEKTIETQNTVEKQDDLAILVQYTQRVYSEKFVKLDIKIFDKKQNKLNDFYQNYGHIQNINIGVTIVNEDNQEIFSSSGITNENGLFQTEYFIPENSKRETLTVTITAESENSKSSKLLQVFSLGEPSDDGKSS
ncbi:hypothetical protein [Nitrosopumilus adriaticus]|uniref:Uncharacterized protein n=1 Tax=Nitrosopumilus adriaticus TaxID=1580092 RepID=A0A0D5C2A8_9ARCH|nr:hypothetical protein [Nitrosopumilus adriaticus]AJW70929.1 conserved exported protein of unknown function [Nitrosopumilus adriaticus]